METIPVDQLFRRCAALGDGSEWQEFIRRYGRRLEAAARCTLRQAGLTPPPDLVEDLVQEVYCRLLDGDRKRLRAFRGRSEGEAVEYLARIAQRVTLDYLRRIWAAKRVRDPYQPRRLADEASESQGLLAFGPPTPEDHVLMAERRRRFIWLCRNLCRGRLRRRNARILKLALLEGWTSREIAEGLRGAPGPSGVDSLVHRFKRRLAGHNVHLPHR